MIEMLGNHFGNAKLDLKDVAPIARQAGIPILVDAAADYLIVPNPYLAQGADLVAYSGGKIIRGPQNAGLLVGRRDLVRAAWANSAPHHAFGRALEGRQGRDRGDAARVEAGAPGATSRQISAVGILVRPDCRPITQVPGVQARSAGADPRRSVPHAECLLGSRAGRPHGRRGRAHAARWRAAHHDPRRGRRPLFPHPAGGDEAGRVRDRRAAALRSLFVRPTRKARRRRSTAGGEHQRASGMSRFEYEVGSARHKLFLAADGNRITGTHDGLGLPGRSQGRNQRQPVDAAQQLARGRQRARLFVHGIGIRASDRRRRPRRRVRLRQVARPAARL